MWREPRGTARGGGCQTAGSNRQRRGACAERGSDGPAPGLLTLLLLLVLAPAARQALRLRLRVLRLHLHQDEGSVNTRAAYSPALHAGKVSTRVFERQATEALSSKCSDADLGGKRAGGRDEPPPPQGPTAPPASRLRRTLLRTTRACQGCQGWPEKRPSPRERLHRAGGRRSTRASTIGPIAIRDGASTVGRLLGLRSGAGDARRELL